MPTYDYKCNKCKKEFEVFQSITSDELTVCLDDNCDGSIVKQISNNKAGFVLNGPGYHKGGHNG
jgi:putative FmdB family regulatory protein